MIRFCYHKPAVCGLPLLLLALLVPAPLSAQNEDQPFPPFRRDFNRPIDDDAPRPFQRGEPDGPRFGGPPGGFRQERKLVNQFDRDGDKRLNTAERKEAREFIAREIAEGRGPRRRGPRFARNENTEPPHPGPHVEVADAKTFPNTPLYASNIVRTLFLEFEGADWEKELADFNNSDVEVPAKLIVDGKTYPNVGVHFRGSSSFMMVGEGRKRSLNLSLDFAHKDQQLLGYRTINLLNSHRDPTFLRSVLYYHIARQYLPAPQANHVKLVINGESWGIYVNVEQFNKDFVKEWFGESKGVRWKTPGSPRGSAGLAYLGEDVSDYRRKYQIKSKDDPAAWTNLIRLCRTLDQTPPEKLEQALTPMLDIDGVLWFLALENVFINSDGYWTRASDFDLYQDAKGHFHIIPYDANETFNYPEAGPMSRGAGAQGVKLDPFAGSNDPNKPLLYRLLAVPGLKARYVAHVRELAEKWLDWDRLGPVAMQYHKLIADEVKADTRKLSSFEAFQKGLSEDAEEEGFRGPERTLSLKSFAEQRLDYLLDSLK